MKGKYFGYFLCVCVYIYLSEQQARKDGKKWSRQHDGVDGGWT